MPAAFATFRARTDPFCRGARGLGYNIAQALCDVNLKSLIILDVLKEHGDEATAMLQDKYGTRVEFKQVDVRDERSIQNSIDEVCSDKLLSICH